MSRKPGRKWGTLRGEYVEVCQLANVLRDIADERMVTIRSLAARMPYERTKISQSLNGSTRPEWSFIEAFIAACTGSDQIARAVLERKIRPLWEAASPGRARPLAEVTVARGEAAHAAVPPESRAWVSAMHDAAHTQNVVVRLQQSVNRHQDLAEGLMGMMDRLTYAVEKLTVERDSLRAELHSLADLADDLRLTRQRLEDTQQRLRTAEQLQAETSKRLDEALHQLKEGERIKREALARLDRAQQRLVELEQHAGGAIGAPETDPDAEDAIPILMGETDQHIAAEILRQVDDVLDEEAANLDELRVAVGDPSARPPERRAFPVGRGTANAAAGADNLERYRSLIEASSQVVWVTDENGRVAEDAPEWRSITGQAIDDYLAGGWLAVVHPEDRSRIEAVWRECVASRRTFRDRYRVRTKTGIYREFEVRAVPIWRGDEVIEWVGANADVTGQREAEEMRGRLTEQLSAAALRTARLQQATSMLAEALTVSQVVQVITEVGRSAIGADRSAVALLDGDKLRMIAQRGDTCGGVREDIAVRELTVLSVAVREVRPILAESPAQLRAQLRDEAEPFLSETDERAWVGLPLVAAGVPIGALRFSFTRPREINEEERVFLEALAGQCALAVERARLFEREHQTAETLQRSLLPDSLPQLPGIQLAARYHPATRHVQVGGDWYDAFGLPDGRLAIAVGDVMGKGVLAVAGMGRVRNALRALALNDPRPAAVLSGLDRLFSATEDEEQFTTVAYAVIALNTGDGVFSNAGHPPPLLFVGNGVALLGDGEPGTPLGWPSQRRQTSFSVSPGNAVVFYSDGLVENRRRGLDAGLDELVKVAADASPDVMGDPERLVDYLIDRMLADYERDDDLTVLAARRL